jgi:hypothetical protein
MAGVNRPPCPDLPLSGRGGPDPAPHPPPCCLPASRPPPAIAGPLGTPIERTQPPPATHFLWFPPPPRGQIESVALTTSSAPPPHPPPLRPPPPGRSWMWDRPRQQCPGARPPQPAAADPRRPAARRGGGAAGLGQARGRLPAHHGGGVDVRGEGVRAGHEGCNLWVAGLQSCGCMWQSYTRGGQRRWLSVGGGGRRSAAT